MRHIIFFLEAQHGGLEGGGPKACVEKLYVLALSLCYKITFKAAGSTSHSVSRPSAEHVAHTMCVRSTKDKTSRYVSVVTCENVYFEGANGPPMCLMTQS